MKIDTLSFGKQTIDADDIISFPHGFIGFESYKKFKLFHEEKESPTVHWLQSITDKNFAMSMVSPTAFGIDYELILNDEEQQVLKLEKADDAIIALIIYKQHDDQNAEIKVMTKAPIIINVKDKIGLQKSLGSIEINNLAA
ncbi:MAG: flagellar biosynthesis protein FliW [Methylophaga sp.]|nr:MAG: flagellar biosynthesis protein FliW [Methylophaga sp.]